MHACYMVQKAWLVLGISTTYKSYHWFDFEILLAKKDDSGSKEVLTNDEDNVSLLVRL